MSTKQPTPIQWEMIEAAIFEAVRGALEDLGDDWTELSFVNSYPLNTEERQDLAA